MYDTTNLDVAIIWLLTLELISYSAFHPHYLKSIGTDENSTIYKSYGCKKKNWLIKFHTNYTGTCLVVALLPTVILLIQCMLLLLLFCSLSNKFLRFLNLTWSNLIFICSKLVFNLFKHKD